MADLGQFDATDVPPAEAFEIIPAGRYTAMIVESDIVPTSKNDGQIAKFTWQIVDGPHTGRKLFQNLNIDNPSEKATAIAKRELSAVCHATGQILIRDTCELHDKPCTIVVKVTPAKDGYAEKNEIKGVEAVGGKPQAAPAKSAPAQAPAAPAPSKPAGRMPWQK